MKRRQFFSILGLPAVARPQETVDWSKLNIVAPGHLKAIAEAVAPIVVERLMKNRGGYLARMRRALGLPEYPA